MEIGSGQGDGDGSHVSGEIKRQIGVFDVIFL
jgi:hypothetical protein